MGRCADMRNTGVWVETLADGTRRATPKNLVAMEAQCHYASNIAISLTSVNMLTDEADERMSPKAIARLACDVAQALVNEFEERDWLLPLEPFEEKKFSVVTRKEDGSLEVERPA